jgi:hypothetical protein
MNLPDHLAGKKKDPSQGTYSLNDQILKDMQRKKDLLKNLN